MEAHGSSPDLPSSSSCSPSSTSSPVASRRTSRCYSPDDSRTEDGFTPTRRNKRKMTEPRRRTDFSIRRICSSGEDDQPRSKRPRTSPTGEEDIPSPQTSPSSHFAVQHVPPPALVPRTLYPSAASVPGFFPSLGAAVAADRTRPDMPPTKASPSSGSASSCSPPPPSLPRGPSPMHPYGTDVAPDFPSSGRRARKNYKNMTRERRVEANARERSRVHTISAAFESLRRAVPSYSYNQRLSKLAILRIACSYITALSRLADLDYSPDQSKPSFAECVDLCTRTIQAEGKAKRRH